MILQKELQQMKLYNTSFLLSLLKQTQINSGLQFLVYLYLIRKINLRKMIKHHKNQK